ncbi:MAG: ABC transporter ATP-binding protein [Actinobacteria bacterium]|nr:ABC transporter ATP-binding protein [Actinomycetota bacterium]
MTAGPDRADHPASIEVVGLGHVHPEGRRALEDVSFRIGPGERVALLGANGSGKTTLLLHLNGLLRATEGLVRIDDLTVDDGHVSTVRRRVGFVFQDADDQLFLPTIGRDVAFGPAKEGLRGAALDERVAAALDAVGLAGFADRAPHQLSAGERRRAALATVLAMRPGALVLDEPTADLDARGRVDLGRALDAMSCTLVLVTHDLVVAAEHGDRVLILDEGRLVADGPAADLLDDVDLLVRHGVATPPRRRRTRPGP